jgi:hypothetical protein
LFHDIPQGNYLAINLNTEIKFKNFIIESIDAKVGSRPKNTLLRTLLALNPHTKIRHYGISMSIEIFDIFINDTFECYSDTWIFTQGIFLAHGPENIMRETFGNIIEELPMKLSDLSEPVAVPPIPQVKYCVIL